MSKEINLKIDEKLFTSEVRHFTDTAVECIELYAKKNADYGNSFDVNMDKFGEIVGTIRIGDKYSRLEKLTKPGAIARVNDESIDDTLIDLACYSIMMLSYRKRKKFDIWLALHKINESVLKIIKPIPVDFYIMP